MKRKILAALLAVSMILQCTIPISAEVMPAENIPNIEETEQTSSPIGELNVQLEDDSVEIVEDTPHAVKGIEENVTWTLPQYDDEIDWAEANPDYWKSIDWSIIEWYELSGAIGPGAFPDGWSEKVEWASVNWENINWSGYYPTLSMMSRRADWLAIKWDKVKWENMYWTNVDWRALKDLDTQDKIDLLIEYTNDTSITTPVSPQTINGQNFLTISSDHVTIKVKGSGNDDNSYCTIPKEAYTITVEKDGNNYKLAGILNKPAGGTSSFDSIDFFKGCLTPTIIEDQPASIADENYWAISVDDTKCTFANLTQNTHMPEVTIKSSDGSVVLNENEDYEVKDTTSGVNEFSLKENSHQVTITALSSDKVGSGTVKKNFTVHYADINDFYTLKGIPEKITVHDSMPEHATATNQPDRKTETDLIGHLYLKPKDNASLQDGRLPKINLEGQYPQPLWNVGICLNVEYGYVTAKGLEWFPSFTWGQWSSNHLSDTIYIKVSVNEQEAFYPQPTLDARFIKGSITSSVQVIPYSLEEVNQGQRPATQPLNNGDYYIAAVNPVPVEFEDSGKPGYERIDERVIDSVTYNGKTHTPGITWSVYVYRDFWFGGGKYYDDYYDVGLLNPNITYENNINAGTGKVRISFDGVFTGSITREFAIKPKDISDVTDKSITIQAQDFLYDGNPHAPILAIFDSQANTVLREDVDYTVTTTSNTTSPGTVTATITGIKNYTGTRTVQYKIVSTSVTVTGTKLEQVANIPDKIDNQKYTGQPVTPEVVITGKNPSMKLVKDRDYKVSYLNNIESGTAYAVVEGIGNYGGTYIIPFVIGERLSQKIVVLPAQERDLKKRTLFSKPTVVKYTESPKTDTTYTSSNPNIVKVDAKTSAIEYKGIGTAVITINAAASDIYNAAIKELTVKVLPRTPKDVAVRFVAGKGIAVTGSAVPEASKYQLRIQKSGHRSVFVNIDNIGALDTAYQTKSKGKFNVWVRAYKTVNGVEHFSGWTSKRTVIVK